jgi:hypothetical protein
MKKRRSWPSRLFWWFPATLSKLISFAAGGISTILGKSIGSLFSLSASISKVLQKKPRDKALSNPPRAKDLTLVTSVKGNYTQFTQSLSKSSKIMLIFGKRGSGKSALGFRILENTRVRSSRPCYVLGVEQSKVPSWVESIDSIETAHTGGVVLIDEGAIAFGARESMSKRNRELVRIMAIARHKDLSLIFITQNTGLIDKNILKLVDTLLIKEGSLLQLEMERSEIRSFYAKTKSLFEKAKLPIAQAYIIDEQFEGMLSFKLPSFWSEGLSKNNG